MSIYIDLPELFGTDNNHAIFQALQRIHEFNLFIETISDGGITIERAVLAYIPNPIRGVRND